MRGKRGDRKGESGSSAGSAHAKHFVLYLHHLIRSTEHKKNDTVISKDSEQDSSARLAPICH